MARRRAVLLAAACAMAAPAVAEDRLSFWNLTGATITNLVLSPAGADAYGPNQCANDPDGAVDHDERLRLAGITPGRYDVRLTTKAGRVCTVPDVPVKAGGKYAFSLADADLVGCR